MELFQQSGSAVLVEPEMHLWMQAAKLLQQLRYQMRALRMQKRKTDAAAFRMNEV